MGLLDLFFKPDPTADWPPAQPRTLTLDFVNGDLDGLRMGMPWTELVRFGRPANKRPYREQHFVYPELGVHFRLIHDRVWNAVFELRDTDLFGDPVKCARWGTFTPPRLRIVQPDGWPMEPTTATTLEEVRRRFGEPAFGEGEPVQGDGGPGKPEGDDDRVFRMPDYLALTYTRSDWLVEFEFGPGPHRTLNAVEMGTAE